MCATCVAEGATYVGGAVAGLKVMALRAGARTRRKDSDEVTTPAVSPQSPQPGLERPVAT